MFVADSGRSAADCGQGGVWKDLSGSALQWRLGPHKSAHLLGHAHAGRLLPNYSWFWGASWERVAEFWSPLPAGKQSFHHTPSSFHMTKNVGACLVSSLIVLKRIIFLSVLDTAIRTTRTPTAPLFLFSSLTVSGSWLGRWAINSKDKWGFLQNNTSKDTKVLFYFHEVSCCIWV